MRASAFFASQIIKTTISKVPPPKSPDKCRARCRLFRRADRADANRDDRDWRRRPARSLRRRWLAFEATEITSRSYFSEPPTTKRIVPCRKIIIVTQIESTPAAFPQFNRGLDEFRFQLLSESDTFAERIRWHEVAEVIRFSDRNCVSDNAETRTK